MLCLQIGTDASGGTIKLSKIFSIKKVLNNPEFLYILEDDKMPGWTILELKATVIKPISTD